MATSPETSEIFGVEIRPAGEYSRFFRTHNAQKKTIGGDSWRVHLDGPSYLAGTVFDLNDGVYEVLFLIMEPGAYKIDMIEGKTVGYVGFDLRFIFSFSTTHARKIGKRKNILKEFRSAKHQRI